ncbi:MAG: hypothetical protein IPL61_25260 [Myxococcales bacterium]|nr:hypothetical protein [Myxococcales bacterium]
MIAGARAALVAAALVAAPMACGGAQPRPGGGGGGGSAVDAGRAPVDAAEARDPATVTLLAALAEQRDRACACADRACAEDAEALAVQWGLDHREVVRAAAPGPLAQAEAEALLDAAEDCLHPWFEAGAHDAP